MTAFHDHHHWRASRPELLALLLENVCYKFPEHDHKAAAVNVDKRVTLLLKKLGNKSQNRM